jgi:hypothetical protein
MSVLGTSIAAGVAQTAHQAQQVARARDVRQKRPQARPGSPGTEDSTLRLPEEDEHVETSDMRVEDRSSRNPSEGDENRPGDVEQAAAAPQKPVEKPEAQDSEDQIYRHLDLQA